MISEDEGGLTYIKGNNSGNNLYFYWSMGEYDADGNVVFDGDWRGVNESWTVGQELNHSSYGASGYPSGISQSDRESRVAYVMPVFRWAKGSLAVGGGSENTFRPGQLANGFEIIQLVTEYTGCSVSRIASYFCTSYTTGCSMTYLPPFGLICP